MDAIDGTLVLTLRLDLYDEEERNLLVQNLQTLISERVERWPESVASYSLEDEFLRKARP